MQTILKPKPLSKHATIGIFTPSEPITQERLHRVKAGIDFLTQQGYQVITGQNYLEQHYYMAGTVAQRVADIHALLARDDVEALLASWGGKSCNQLLPHLEYGRFTKTRKLLIGFSDQTCLANAVFAKTGLINFLGPNVLGKLDESIYSDLHFLQSPSSDEVLVGQKDSVTPLKQGKCIGRLIGGTLGSFTAGVMHTEFAPSLANSILFLEAGSKTPQLLDQILTHANNAHSFDMIAGLVICNTDHCKDERNWGSRQALDIFREAFSQLNIPIIHTPVIGHGRLKNPIMPVGSLCSLNADEGVLKLLEPVLE